MGSALLEDEAPSKLIGDLATEFSRRVARHLLEFLGEVRLVIVVVVKLFFQNFKG